MAKKIIYVVMIVIGQNVHAQYKEKNLLLYTKEKGTYSYFEYPHNVLLKAGAKDSANFVRKYPEETIWSYFCASNQDWVNSLYLKDKPSPIESALLAKSGKMKPDSNYLQLISKLELTQNGKQICFLKYYQKYEGEKLESAYRIVEKKGAKWYFNSSEYSQSVGILIWTIEQKYLNQLFNNEDSDSKIINHLRGAAFTNGIIDLNKLADAFLKGDFEKMEYEKIKDPKCKF